MTTPQHNDFDPRDLDYDEIRIFAGLRLLSAPNLIAWRPVPVDALAPWLDPGMAPLRDGPGGEEAVLLGLQQRVARFPGDPELATWRPLFGYPRLARYVQTLLDDRTHETILWPLWRLHEGTPDLVVIPSTIGRLVAGWARALETREVPFPPAWPRPARAERLRCWLVEDVAEEPYLGHLPMLAKLALVENISIRLMIAAPLAAGEDLLSRVAHRHGGGAGLGCA